MHKEKVLIIRFNSIGDIVLTFPTVRALAGNNFEVHYLSKETYAPLLQANPQVSKLWTIKKDVNEVAEELEQEQFKYVIDLHNNFRSRKIKKQLGVESYTLIKYPVSNFLLTQFDINVREREHIVDRFLKTTLPLCGDVHDRRLELFIPKEVITEVDNLNLPLEYIVVSVGAAYRTKQIPTQTLVKVIEEMNVPVVLLGGTGDKIKAEAIESSCRKEVINLVGQVDILISSEIIRRSNCVLTGDTGLLHIAAALKKNIVAVYGSTHPILGYTPYVVDNASETRIVQKENLSCRPCTKQGKKKCPKGHFKCMTEIDSKVIVDNILSLVEVRN